MASGRVYPNSSMAFELGVESVAYRGGAMSSFTQEELESHRNVLTLKEARWQGVRKKVPGMKNQLKSRQTGQVEQNPYFSYMREIRDFVNKNFHKKECERFVPKPDQLEGPKAVKRNGDLKCGCGEILMDHAFMQTLTMNKMISPRTNRSYTMTPDVPNFDETTQLDIYVPSEIREHFTKGQRQKLTYTPVPELKWQPTDIKRKLGDCTFGKINFENMEHIGGRKPAKYIRMTDDDDVDNLVHLMKEYWKIMEPEKPNLVISVVGGAKNFKLDGRNRDTFATGLIKAAKTTSAWLITSGFNMGVMKAVGQAVRQGQSFCWDNDRMVHVLRCIGIAPWGYVRRKKDLECFDGQGKFYANYLTSNVILHDSPVPLNPDHTHFIFVDDGYRNRYGGVAGIRAKLEQKISDSGKDGLGIPVVLVVVEGGTDAINDAKTSLEHNIPVVVCAGTGRAADIIAYAFTHTKTSGGQRIMKEKHESKLQFKIYDAYGKNWKEEEISAKTTEIFEKVTFCCQNPDLLTVFYMNKHEDLDLAILSVLLKAKKGADEKQRLSQLNLALMWDRVDIAQEEIFREDVLWSPGSLDDTLTRALVTNKVKFVDLILQQGSLVMKEYLTKSRLQMLYNEIPKNSHLEKIMHKLIGSEKLHLDNVYALCKRLLDRFDTVGESLEVEEDDSAMKDTFQRPYKMLLVWAVLLCRVDMAKLFMELGEEPVTSALAASRMVHAMAKNMPQLESNIKEKLMEAEIEFERLATCIVNECHHSDPEKAMMIVERKSPCWNDMTCLQIAAASTNQVFLSTVTCQQSVDVTWKRGIMAGWFKVLLAMLFPPFIIWGIEILNPGQKKLSARQKLLLFYSSPLSKFSYGVIMYGVFLVLHSYLVLVDYRESHVTALEVVVVIWVLTFFVDSLHTIIAFPTPTFRAKIRDWFDFFKWLEFVNYGLAFAGFIGHLAGYYSAAKVMYCVCTVLFFLSILKIYVAHGQLGPKIFMIRKMGNELRMFIMVLIVFLLAYGVASQGLLYFERSADWVILKDVLYFPYWQLYGEIELDEIASDETCDSGSKDCRTFHWLVPVFLMFYLLVGNILLLNLLIAIFSHVFQTVEENSNKIWKYQRYFLAMEYDCKTHLVPPFSIIQHVYLIIRWILQQLCCKTQKNKQVYAKYQLDYLQVFEKEMMMNFLRMEKAEEMSGIEMTVDKLQKRVDDLTKLIEDEVIADQDPAQVGITDTASSKMVFQEQLEKLIQQAQIETKLGQNTQNDADDAERKEKKKKKKHKKEKKKKKEKEEKLGETHIMSEQTVEHGTRNVQEESDKIDITSYARQKETNGYEEKLNNINLPPNIGGIPEKPDPGTKLFHKPSDQGVSYLNKEDSGSATENASPFLSKRESHLKTTDEKPVSPQWLRPPRGLESLDSDDEEDDDRFRVKRRGLISRLSSSSMARYVSSESEDDTGFRNRLKKRMNKKKKKHNRNASDTE